MFFDILCGTLTRHMFLCALLWSLPVPNFWPSLCLCRLVIAHTKKIEMVDMSYGTLTSQPWDLGPCHLPDSTAPWHWRWHPPPGYRWRRRRAHKQRGETFTVRPMVFMLLLYSYSKLTPCPSRWFEFSVRQITIGCFLISYSYFFSTEFLIFGLTHIWYVLVALDISYLFTRI